MGQSLARSSYNRCTHYTHQARQGLRSNLYCLSILHILSQKNAIVGSELCQVFVYLEMEIVLCKKENTSLVDRLGIKKEVHGCIQKLEKGFNSVDYYFKKRQRRGEMSKGKAKLGKEQHVRDGKARQSQARLGWSR